MGTYISSDIVMGTYTRARLVVEYTGNAANNTNAVRAYVQAWRTNTGYTTAGSGKLHIGIDGYGWETSTVSSSQEVTYNSYTQIGATRSLTIENGADGTWNANFYVWAENSTTGNLAFSEQTFRVKLASNPVYNLTISAGTGSSITVNRISSTEGGAIGNLTAGTKKLYVNDKLKITFAAGSNYGLITQTVNGYAFASGGTHTVGGNVTVEATAQQLKSAVSATDANIGSTSSIIITRYNNSYTHALTYKFGNLKGSIPINNNETTIPWTVPPEFYAQIPNDPDGICTITCTTYNGGVPLGDTSCTMTVTAAKKQCAPTVSVEAVDCNQATFALTGDIKKIIRFHSDIQVTANLTAKNSATLSNVAIRCGGDVAGFALSGTAGEVTKTFTDAESIDISATVMDSRDYPSTDTVTDLTLIEYTKLTVNAEAKRTGPTSDEVNVSVKGMYYNGSFGAVNNTLQLRAQHKPKGQAEFADNWVEMSVTIKDDGTYTAEATLTGVDYKQICDIRVQASDAIYKKNGPLADAVYHDLQVNKGIPIFDWGENDFNFNVPVSLKNQFIDDFPIEYGISDIWHYTKWASGKIELWTDSILHTVNFQEIGPVLLSTESDIPVPLIKTIEYVNGGVRYWHYTNWSSVTQDGDGALSIDIRYYGLNMLENGEERLFFAHIIGTWKGEEG